MRHVSRQISNGGREKKVDSHVWITSSDNFASWGGGGECIESNGENLQSTPFCLRRTTIHVCSLPVEGASSATTVSKLLIRRIHVRDGITHGFASYLGGVDNDRT